MVATALGDAVEGGGVKKSARYKRKRREGLGRCVKSAKRRRITQFEEESQIDFA